MNQRKPNISPWYALGLAVVLMAFCLVMATGVTWARYRTDAETSLLFETRKPLTVCLGKVVTGEDGETEVFQQTDASNWETLEGKAQLNFAVSNGTETSFESRSQQIRIRLVGSLGVLTEAEAATVKLVLPVEPAEEEVTDPTDATEAAQTTKEYAATAVRITKDSPLYTTFGDGWVFCFLDEEGEELLWTLPGGTLSFMDMTITMESGAVTDTSLLQLHITSQLAD